MIRSMKHTRARSATALLVASMLVLTPVLQGAPPAQPAPKEEPPVDGGWPRAYDLGGGDSAVIYQPQVATWEGQKHLVAWAAVAYQAKDAKQEVPGTIKIEADTQVALDERLVSFSDFQITEANFPSLPKDQTGKIAADLKKAVPLNDRVIALDRVLANMDKSAVNPKAREAAGVKADPPKIFSSTKPAVIVNFDGKPVWSPIKDNDLKFAVNTNWDVFEAPSKTLYLLHGDSWLQAADVNGPWAAAGPLPAGFAKLPADDNWKDVKARVPGKPIAAGALPKVFVSLEPAELIVTEGEPKYTTVEGTSLLWVSNTESDLFRAGKTGPFYYLVAGRWFSAPGLDGPWTFATPSLPADFKKIPVDHPRSRVLASVPGTDEAAEAVLLAQVPQTARVNKKELKAPEVTYQGEPELKPIEGTSLQRAVNTDKDVIKAADLYYLCFQGVWFTSRSAKGPWEVASSVPPEVYRIPASSPVYHVTYVTVEDDDPADDWVTFAAYAGYTGMMVAWGCAVWGTGWYYPPYIWYGGYYPGYIWHSPTYGFASWYNPYTGTYGRGAAVYGPYGGAGGWAAYNPRTGTYARGGAVYGPYGSRSFAQAYNPRTGTYGATRQGSNVYGNWGSSYVQRGDDWARTGHYTNYRTGTTTRVARGSEGGGIVTRSGPEGRGGIAKTGSGDIYAGHDGNAYRKQDDGSWQKWSDGGWSNVDKPQQGAGDRPSTGTREGSGGAGTRAGSPATRPTTSQLDRDWGARNEGSQRMRDHQSWNQGGRGGRASAGSFRGGGGRRR